MGFEFNSKKSLQERAFLVGIRLPTSTLVKEREYLDELEQLAKTAGAKVVGKTIQGRTRIDGATYIGPGKAGALKEECAQVGANLVVIDGDLSPVQARNLQQILDLNVIDRTELILDIFARHAKSRQAKIQVELAQLTYSLPRLRKLWVHLSRQAGGIGIRGPGETQLEVDRRRVDQRIGWLKKQLEKIGQRRQTLRLSRSNRTTVAIVGYTNAGKSTLLNALAGTDTLVADKLFATLDTLTRRMPSSNHIPIYLVDTIGFIRKLPHHLVESFKATLDDIAEARLYLHLIDLSHPAYQEQMAVVNNTLRGIDNPSVETLLVFNKIDQVEEQFLETIKKRYPRAVFISATRREGVEEVKRTIEQFFNENNIRVEVEIPAGDGKNIARVGSLLHNMVKSYRGDQCVIKGTVDRRMMSSLEQISGAKVRFLLS